MAKIQEIEFTGQNVPTMNKSLISRRLTLPAGKYVVEIATNDKGNIILKQIAVKGDFVFLVDCTVQLNNGKSRKASVAVTDEEVLQDLKKLADQKTVGMIEVTLNKDKGACYSRFMDLLEIELYLEALQAQKAEAEALKANAEITA